MAPAYSGRLPRCFEQVLSFMESFSLKEPSEKAQFLESLGPQVPVLPAEVKLYKILPLFRNYVHVEYGQAVANPSQRQLILASLPTLLAIVGTLSKGDFAELAESMVVQLFEFNDREVRILLLQHLQTLAPNISDANINGRVFESVQTGFSDSMPQLREMTLKSIICITERLSEKNMNDRLLRCLSKLHADPEPSIRTNTTIFLGRIAAQLKEGSRLRIILPAFLKACRDPFPHARLAGLKAAAACASYFDAITIATKVLPTICTLLVGPSSQNPVTSRACCLV
jgi:SCY1-like protein 1